MAKKTDYVKLKKGATAFADLASGFAITGLDVVKIPEYAKDVVAERENMGHLVYATKAEYDAVHGDDPEVKVEEPEVPHQENKVIEKAEAKRKKVVSAREKAEKAKKDEDDKE